jgi:hypothetical protein
VIEIFNASLHNLLVIKLRHGVGLYTGCKQSFEAQNVMLFDVPRDFRDTLIM